MEIQMNKRTADYIADQLYRSDLVGSDPGRYAIEAGGTLGASRRIENPCARGVADH